MTHSHPGAVQAGPDTAAGERVAARRGGQPIAAPTSSPVLATVPAGLAPGQSGRNEFQA